MLFGGAYSYQQVLLTSQLQCLPLKIFDSFTWAMGFRYEYFSLRVFAKRSAQSMQSPSSVDCASFGAAVVEHARLRTFRDKVKVGDKVA
jgi:hypothetical protein